MDILGTVTGTIELTRKLLALQSLERDTDARLLIAELKGRLAELKFQVAGLLEENHGLKEAAKSAADMPQLVLKEGVYYTKDDDGPFCTACVDSHKKLIHVTHMPASMHVAAKWACPVCEAKYGGDQQPVVSLFFKAI